MFKYIVNTFENYIYESVNYIIIFILILFTPTIIGWCIKLKVYEIPEKLFYLFSSFKNYNKRLNNFEANKMINNNKLFYSLNGIYVKLSNNSYKLYEYDKYILFQSDDDDDIKILKIFNY